MLLLYSVPEDLFHRRIFRWIEYFDPCVHSAFKRNIFFVGNIRHMEIRNAETLIRKPGMNLCLKIIPRNRQMINVAECEQQSVSCVSFDIVL